MFLIGRRRISIMVAFAIILHIVWATILIFDASALRATALHALSLQINSTAWLVFVLYFAAISAAAGMLARPTAFALLLIPQQVLLMISAAGAIGAIWLGQFADGVLRSRAFIGADQAYSIIAAVTHTIAIVSLVVHQRDWK